MDNQETLEKKDNDTQIYLQQQSPPLRKDSDNRKKLNQTSEEYLNSLTPTQRRQRITTLLVIAFISFLTGIDYAIILPTAWGYINMFMHNHYGGFVMGILLSVFALSGAIAGILFGFLDDIGVSLKKLVLCGTVFIIIGNTLYFIGINIYVVVISRLIAGIGMGLVPPLLAELTRRSTPETRTQLFAKVLGCRQVGLFFGPCFTIFIKQLNFKLFGLQVTMYNAPGLLMAVLWVVVILLTLCFFYDSPIAITDPKSLSEVLKNNSFRQVYKYCLSLIKSPVIMVLLATSFIAYFNQTALETTLTPFTNRQFNWHEVDVSILFAVAGIEITIVYIGLHYISKKVRDQTILVSAFIILSIACLVGVIILPFSKIGSTKYLPIFLLFVGLDILALPLIAVTTATLFSREMNLEQQGIGQGIQRFVVNIATVVGPLFAGALLQATWTMILVMFIIVLLATILLLFMYRSFRINQNDELTALISPVNNSS
ncbi:unnamed protein product [Adineta steineri]|uniref:Major facilitator superfamily (MFS) profile domain-containing protein n=1 Tax=Adineta steineri TaxID=433720 RepID=A0A815GE98_9BILA|nr:unnamed protein product [Adineta steineri]CAF3670239.1 unnamed protein product [Adineta steineri]